MSFAGIPSHSHQALHTAKNTQTFANPINIVFFVSSCIILSTSSLMILSSVIPAITSALSLPTAHPTSIPWINNESDCRHTGRSWQDNKCWDHEHSLMF
ncbi:hypothetical protein [Nostoc sp. FACHB-190]|uniref:hypothetical protein n=1 Tax=Nostoc sp. FACHB-190 TaxID=2692838 RepID=UPI0016846BDE|nr:hypothetical protein [Nostoc sp. FACHB-190]MBD2299275.1 hypothetical protein [Nostoc sp. FACHB-190]